MKNTRFSIIAVLGSSQPEEGTAAYDEARVLGSSLAESGFTVMSGGYGGVMEAASRGAQEAGGSTLGVVLASRPAANRWIDNTIVAPSYGERLLVLMQRADGYVIMRGGSGTLSELFLAWELVKNGSVPHRPIVLYGTHWRAVFDSLRQELSGELAFREHMNLLSFADTPEDALAQLQKIA